MGIRASDHPALMAAVMRQLEKEKAGQPEPPKVMWVMRTNLPKIKPFKTRNPVEFKLVVEKVQEMNPGLKIYLFEITGI
jgi:hypothetical protein